MAEKEAKTAAAAADSRKEKKSIFTQRQIRFTIATTLVLLTLLGLSVLYVIRVYLMTESACYQDLAIETEDAIADLEGNLRSDRTALRIIADLIGNSNDIESIQTSSYLSNYDINNQITHLSMLLPNNDVITANGRKSNIGETLDYVTEYEQGEHINGGRITMINSAMPVVHNYVPIRSNGICIGMLFSTANSSNISKAWMPNMYDHKGYCYVVDRKTGNVLINSSGDDILDINDLSFRQTDASYTKQATIDNILSGKKGYSVFKSELSSEKLYMCYLPFSIEDWEMVVLVPENEVFSAVAPIRSGMYMLVTATAVIIVIYTLWLIREIRRAIIDTEEIANVDVLTDLKNRNRYEAYIEKLAGTKEELTCVFVDANGLHELNNSRGHTAGDQMLRFIADTLKVEFGGDSIFRIGGDEFVVFRADMSEEDLNRRISNFNEALQRNDYHAAVGTCVMHDGMTVDELIQRAEKDMYEAKREYYEHLGKEMRI